jgi:thiamine biosynthesis lipoprotein
MPECGVVFRIAAAAALCLCLVATGCSRGDPAAPVKVARLVERARVSMGSEVRLTAWTADERNALATFEHIFQDFDYLDRLLSVWHAESKVSQVNAAAGREPVTVPAEVIELLQTARQVGEWTNGKFDVTFGALSGLWKFDHDQDNRIPSPRDVAARLPLIDHRAVDVNPKAGTVFLRRAGMRLHLGGIGKGFAVDRAAAIFRAHGIHDFLIQSGGDLYASGRRGDRAWRAAIKDPRGQAIIAALELNDETFSTSGDYERFFMKDGRRYHHILDPDNGQPAAAGSRSVTIVAPTATVADGLSTGVFIMGPEAGMALIERLPDVEGVIVSDRNEVLVSSGLRGRLEMLSAPTDAP